MMATPAPIAVQKQPSETELAPGEMERGWRYVRVTLPDGNETFRQVLLTPEDYLNPQEGDVMPQRPFHAQANRDLGSMLTTRYANDPVITVFQDLIMNWGIPGLPNPSPDTAVVPNVRDPQKDRGEFKVQEEGTRPTLVVEVVSPQYRKEDREDKVSIYERAGIPELVLLDHREQRGQFVDEALGYRLVNGRYRPIAPDENGFILCETVDLRIGLEHGRVVLVDVMTGQRLRTHEEEQAARQAAEARAEAEAAARAEAEARLAALEDELRRLRGDAEP
ncbi:MAG: Uma2 family endonuclease [Chloroflexi bacterium]|nr:Uma2 family endonuclease [Chloroflexota bacterium]